MAQLRQRIRPTLPSPFILLAERVVLIGGALY